MSQTLTGAVHKALVLGLCSLLACPAALAQEKRPGEVATTIEVDILTLDVLVLDKHDQPILDLKPEEMEVRVGGRVLPLEGFDAPAAPPRPGAQPNAEPAPVELVGGSTQPLTPSGRPALHVLLYFDLEQLPTSSLLEAARGGLAYARNPEGSPRIGVVTYFGRAATHAWDETSIALVESELDQLAETPAEAVSAGGSTSVVRSDPRKGVSTVRGGQPGAARGWDQRHRLEATLVDGILDAEAFGNEATAQTAYAAFGDYLREERQRVKESVQDLRETCERFALLGDRRHLVLFTQGVERIPGLAAVEFLRQARENAAASASAGATAPFTRQMEGTSPRGFPGSLPRDLQGRLVFDDTPLRELEDLQKWIGATGITVHVVDPTMGAELPSAERGMAESHRDFGADRHALQDGVMPLVEPTGGLFRLNGDAASALGSVLHAAASSYRVAVRLTGVETGRSYKVQVAVKRKGARALARSAYAPASPKAPAPAAAHVTQADAARRNERVDERRPGAARLAPKQIPISLKWMGKSGVGKGSPPPNLYKLDVVVPYDALRFVPEEDSMVASCKITVDAQSLDATGPPESFTEDVFLSLTGAEYSAAAGHDVTRTITLPLAPGRYELGVSLNDVLEGSYGSARERVDAGK